MSTVIFCLLKLHLGSKKKTREAYSCAGEYGKRQGQSVTASMLHAGCSRMDGININYDYNKYNLVAQYSTKAQDPPITQVCLFNCLLLIDEIVKCFDRRWLFLQALSCSWELPVVWRFFKAYIFTSGFQAQRSG